MAFQHIAANTFDAAEKEPIALTQAAQILRLQIRAYFYAHSCNVEDVKELWGRRHDTYWRRLHESNSLCEALSLLRPLPYEPIWGMHPLHDSC